MIWQARMHEVWPCSIQELKALPCSMRFFFFLISSPDPVERDTCPINLVSDLRIILAEPCGTVQSSHMRFRLHQN